MIDWASHQSWWPGVRDFLLYGGPVMVVIFLFGIARGLDDAATRLKRIEEAIYHLRRGDPPDY